MFVAGLVAAAVVLYPPRGPAQTAVVDAVAKDAVSLWPLAGSWPGKGAAPVPNAPVETQNDGNLCGDDEEEFVGLCYKKCALLTNRVAPIRTSSFSCCKNHPCGLTNEVFNVKPCAGFDVGGSINGEQGECPHAEGTCLVNEEMILGICYKKCSVLTGGAYPLRVAATTCCKASSLAGCLNPMMLKTEFRGFSVGGGKGDGNPDTPALPHGPMKSLTELNKPAL